jgi:hypothetical protein
MKKTTLLVSVGLLVLVAWVVYLATSRPVVTVQKLSQAEFLDKFQSNLIGKLQISYPPKPPLFVQYIRGTFYETNSSGQLLLENGVRKELHFHVSFRIPDDLMMQFLANTNIQLSTITLNSAAQKVKDVLSQRK